MQTADLDLLVDRFVSTFERLDELWAFKEIDPIAWQISTGESDEFERRAWRPVRANTDPSALNPLYAKLPARFPSLFERLVLRYRWAEVDLECYRLFANPPGLDLSGLYEQISKDPFLYDSLLRSGYIPFGKGPDVDYDPVCFDIRSRKKRSRECGIVKVDHEEILCHGRVRVVAELAPSFEQLLLQTIERADKA
jgi:hypothetical protein